MLDAKRKIQRSTEIVKILLKYGFDDIVSRLPWANKQLVKLRVIESSDSYTVYERIRKAIEELGPIFIKLAQTLSTREGLLPDELILELRKLEDQVDNTVQFDHITFIEEELSIKIDEHFRAVGQEPLASASISEVYEAQLLDGSTVVLKIKRPSINEKVHVDLTLLKELARILTNYQPKLRNLHLPLIVNSFEKTILEELSLKNEQSNIDRFSKNFMDNQYIYVPKLYKEYCTDAILCMEKIDGVKITALKNFNPLKLDVAALVQKGLNLYLEQIIIYGFFHGDPHPGNILIRPDGRIVFLDFGNMGILLPSDKKQLENFVFAVVIADVLWLAEIIEEVALAENITDRRGFHRSLSEIIDMVQHASLGDMDVNMVVEKLWNIILKNGLYFPDYMYQLIRGVTLMEGIGRQLNPGINLYESLKPFAKQLLYKKIQPKEFLNENRSILLSYLRLFARFPQDLNQLINQLKSGKVKHNLEVSGLKGVNRTVQEGVNKIVLAIFFLSLMLLSGATIIANSDPKFLGLPVWSLVFLFLSVIVAFLFLRRGFSDRNY